MGGLSSGVATGLDSFFGTLGQGAGGQVSVSAGIQPPPSPKNESTGGTGSSAASGSASGAESATTTATTSGSGSSAGTASGTNKIPPVTAIYAGSFKGSATVTAGFGNGGKVQCSYTAQFKITLYPNGSASGVQNGGFMASFDEYGNGQSCKAAASQSSFTGTHGNGRVTLTAPNRSYSGQYTAATLTASGGGTGPMTLTGPKAGGKPATARVTGSMTLSRQ